jgi:putative ABC transport system substrate-binding protein
MRYERMLRSVIALALCLVAPLAMAQSGDKITRIGYLSLAPGPSARSDALRDGLRELGYVENRNLVIVYKWTDGNLSGLQNAASELVRSQIDIIVTGGPTATLAAHKATSTIPIVMAADYDPVAAGFVATLAHPGQNITGLSVLNPQLSGKRLELLKDMNPRLANVAVFFNPAEPNAASYLQETRNAAAAMGMQVEAFEIGSPSDLEGAFAAAKKGGDKAIAVLTDFVTLYNRANLVALAAKYRVPVIYTERLFVEAGGLVSYGASDRDLHRHAAAYVDKILKGTAPADLPVEQPTKFELVINTSAAKSIDLQVPKALLLRADDVIQ